MIKLRKFVVLLLFKAVGLQGGAMSRLGDFLMQEGLLSASDRRLIRRESVSHNGSFARSILAIGILSEEELSSLLAAKTSFRRALKDIVHEIDPDMEQLVPAHILAWLEVLPLSVKEGVLSLAMVDPTDIDAANQVRFFTGLRVRPVIATRSEILRGLKKMGAELPLDGNRLESFIKTHVRGATDAEGMLHSNSLPGPTTGSETLGVDLVQKTPVDAVNKTRIPSKVDTKSSGESIKDFAERSIEKKSEAALSSARKPERLDMLSLGLGALTETVSDFRTPPSRSAHAELTVAVQAAMSILNRSTVKLQLSSSLEDALQKFLETMKKSGLTNGLIVRLKNGKADISAHWRDNGFEMTTATGLPDGISEKTLTTAAKSQSGEHSWVDVKTGFGERAGDAVSFWSQASAVPDSLFIVEREDGALLCMVSFAGQYDHDGLRQIFYDSLRVLNGRLS
jgi:hypothetical protein